MSKLFSTLKINDTILKNRIVVSPMCMYSAENGFANDFHFVHYGSRAIGGVGLIIQEATAVSPEGRISLGDLGLYKDEHIEYLKKITSFINQHGSVAGIQLAHAGRKAGCEKAWNGGKQLPRNERGFQTVSSSAIPFYDDDDAPVSLDNAGIQKVILDFKNAAFRAVEAGYQIIEIHAAHGYLIHQFLSPLCNKRNDEYGGSFENRIRLLLEIVKTVKSGLCDNFPLFVRISATDWVSGGWNVDEAVKLSLILKQYGVDLIDTSSGGMVSYAKIPFEPNYQVSFSERIRKESGILTGAVGLITTAEQAEEILQKEQADLIFIGREFLRNPYLPLNWSIILKDETQWPAQYLRAK